MFDRVLNMPQVQYYTGFCVNCILKIHGILNVLSSEYAKVFSVSEV